MAAKEKGEMVNIVGKIDITVTTCNKLDQQDLVQAFSRHEALVYVSS
jgi:hypothetical protein